MADNSTFITGVAEDALDGVFDKLPQWASETTSKRIEQILLKSFKKHSEIAAQLIKSASDTTKLNDDDIKKINDELAELLKNIENDNKAEKDRGVNRKKAADANKDGLTNMTRQAAISAALLKIGAGVNSTFMASIDTFDKLTESGVNVMSGFDGVDNGFEALRQVSALTGVRFTELSKTMEKYSASVNSVGVNTFAKTVAASSVNLRKFGFTTKETGELLGQYLDAQRGYGDVAGKTQEELQSGLERFGKNMTNLSIATGISRKELIGQTVALSRSVEGNLLANKTGEQATEATLAFIGSFKDKKLGQELLKMMTDPVKPLNETFRDFAKVGMGGFAVKLQQNMDQLAQITDPEEKARLNAEFVAANANEINSKKQYLQLLAQSGSAEAAGRLSFLVSLQQSAKDYNSVSKEQREALRKTQEASTAFSNSIENFKAQLQIAITPLIPVLNGLTMGLTAINNVISSITGAAGPVWSSIIAGVASVYTVYKALRLAISPFTTIIGVLASRFAFLRGVVSLLGGPFAWISTAAILIYSNWSDIVKISKSLWEAMGGLGSSFDSMIEYIKTAGSRIIDGVWDIITGPFRQLGDWLSNSWIGKKLFGDTSENKTNVKSNSLVDKQVAALSTNKPGVASANAIIMSPAQPQTTTLDSPSTANAPESASSSKVNASVTPVGAGIEKAPKSADINSMMAFQNAVMEQLLATTKELTSINKDILRYTRAKT